VPDRVCLCATVVTRRISLATQCRTARPLETNDTAGFANTDLDLQLEKHGIHQLIVMGLITHTCVEASVRYAAELGYEVTMVKDATADYSDDEMPAALDVNIPNY
jgi:nicotinamidase-related amidase